MLIGWLRGLLSPPDAAAHVADAQSSLRAARVWIAGYESDRARGAHLTPESVQRADQELEQIIAALADVRELLEEATP